MWSRTCLDNADNMVLSVVQQSSVLYHSIAVANTTVLATTCTILVQ